MEAALIEPDTLDQSEAVSQAKPAEVLPQRRLWPWLLCLVFGFAIIYGAVQNVGYFDASDSWHRFRMMQSLVTTGSPWWTEPGETEPRTCLQTIGPAVAALPFQGMAFILHRLAIIDLPLEQVLVRAALLTTVFYTSVWMGVLGLLCLRLGASRRKATLLCLIAGLGTLIFPYSKSAQGENLVGLGITLILLFLLQLEARFAWWRLFAVGLIYGFLLSCKPELAVVFPLLLFAVLGAGVGWQWRALLNWKRALVFGAGIVPGVALILWYNAIRFGSISNSGTLGEVGGSTLTQYFSHPFWEGIYLQLLSPGKGVFWYSPVLFATMPFLYRLLKRHSRMLWLPYAWWGVMTCLYAIFFTPTGDAALGSRFQVSYLAFGVLPLLAVPPWQTVRAQVARLLIMVLALVSVSLQFLFCAVSFNIDYHRRLHSVNTLEEQVLLARRAYYSIDESLLRGFFTVAREGLLDLYFVRLRPLENALTILPGFWWLLAAAAAAFGTAWYFASRDNITTDCRRFAALQIPTLGLAVLALAKAGSPGEDGLRMEMVNPARAVHRAIVQDIAINNMNDGREVYKVHRPFSIRWQGEILCPEPGTYSIRAESNQSLLVTMAHQQHTILAGGGTADFVVLDSGWQELQILCTDGTMNDRFHITVKFPGETDYMPLRKKKVVNR